MSELNYYSNLIEEDPQFGPFPGSQQDALDLERAGYTQCTTSLWSGPGSPIKYDRGRWVVRVHRSFAQVRNAILCALGPGGDVEANARRWAERFPEVPEPVAPTPERSTQIRAGFASWANEIQERAGGLLVEACEHESALVKGALDAQAEAEQRLFKLRAENKELLEFKKRVAYAVVEYDCLHRNMGGMAKWLVEAVRAALLELEGDSPIQSGRTDRT